MKKVDDVIYVVTEVAVLMNCIMHAFLLGIL
jgi:hypothetical protein